MNTIIDTSFGNLTIGEVSTKMDDWFVVKSKSQSFDRAEFFVAKFNKAFKGYTLLGSNIEEKFTFLSELCGRQPVMRSWFATVSVEYSETTQLPLYLKDEVEPKEYVIILEKLLSIKDELSKFAKERNNLAINYKRDLDAIKVREDDVIDGLIGANNILKIINLSTEALPLSIQLIIQGYVPKDPRTDVVDSKRALAQEYLAKFKIGLLKLNKDNPDINIDKLIEEIQLK